MGTKGAEYITRNGKYKGRKERSHNDGKSGGMKL